MIDWSFSQLERQSLLKKSFSIPKILVPLKKKLLNPAPSIFFVFV